MEYFHFQAGHLRIPQSSSNGCYDPIRRVVTLGDACFADFHCNDLPNTYCKYDSAVIVDNKLFRLPIFSLLSDTTLKILNIHFIHFFT